MSRRIDMLYQPLVHERIRLQKTRPTSQVRPCNGDFRTDSELEPFIRSGSSQRLEGPLYESRRQPIDWDRRASVCMAKGLYNPVGSNNCFLNCAIQVGYKFLSHDSTKIELAQPFEFYHIHFFIRVPGCLVVPN